MTNEGVDVITPLLDAFDFDPVSRSPFLQKYRSREELAEEYIGYSQLKFDSSPHLNDNKTDSAWTAKEEEKLKKSCWYIRWNA